MGDLEVTMVHTFCVWDLLVEISPVDTTDLLDHIEVEKEEEEDPEVREIWLNALHVCTDEHVNECVR